MSKQNGLLAFENDLKENEELRKKYHETIERIVKEGNCHNDAEVISKAAEELGYEIPMRDMEHHQAERESLDQDELIAVNGGREVGEKCENLAYRDDEGNGFCWKDFWCLGTYRQVNEDDYGHDSSCWTVYHCYTVYSHEDSSQKYDHCWEDYSCAYFHHIVN